ncbi:Family of unknown function [Microlunatus sagamiharensis]|uniref:Uncharacterized protein n=1 Tax=Microlunatus sagamiharensis TaxID=546874 RepID=A0A1H2M2Y6_9ACTN|nr:DUF695 domain-containing protein [Microlunatus sagamiharensis]SDU87627.1 Family of unknown function [Microlunatus sagamiharensis]
MALFRRSASKEVPVVRTPTADFWAWWVSTGAGRAASAIRDGAFGDLPDEMSRRVHAIHTDLQWEFSAGSRSQHTLCVTSGGVPELRPLAQRWRRAAPAEDAVWQYEPARSRSADVASDRLELGGHTVELGLTTVTASFNEDRLLFDVVVHHPGFGALEDRERAQVAFLVLDWALGEDDVERWVGAVTTAVDRDPDAVDVARFVATVDAKAAQPLEETWVLLQGRRPDGAPVVATARRPLRWIDHPLLDQHDEVTLAYEPDPNGMPAGPALERLRAQEEALVAAAGPGAMLLAHETAAGERRLHLYSDSEDQNVTEQVGRWVAATAGASLRVEADPAWRAVRHLR